MLIQDLDQIPDDAIDMSQFLAIDDPSQTFKITLLQLVDALVAQRLNALFVKKSGDEMTGPLTLKPAGAHSLLINPIAGEVGLNVYNAAGVRLGKVSFDANGDYVFNQTDAAGGVTGTVMKVYNKDLRVGLQGPFSLGAQGTTADALTRRDFVESSIANAIGPLGVNKSVVLQRPSGAVAGNWYPVIVPASRQGACVSIDTNSGSGSLPMNNCAFVGFVGAGGWSDGGDMVFGHYHRYDGDEKSLASIHVPTEAEGGVVFYVHEAAFPVTVRYNHADVTAAPSTGLSVTQGTSVFNGTTNPDAAAGTKTRVAMIFGDGGPCSNYAGRLYGDSRKPTPAEIGAARTRATIASGGDFTGRTMACVNMSVGGRTYPLTVPLVAGTYWVRERGGESADRDSDFGVTVGGTAPNFTFTAVNGSTINPGATVGSINAW